MKRLLGMWRACEAVPARSTYGEIISGEFDRRGICRTMEKAGGDKLGAVRRLGIGRTAHYRKLNQHNRLSRQGLNRGKDGPAC